MYKFSMLMAVLLTTFLTVSACDRPPGPPAARPKTAISFLHYFTDSLSGGLTDMARSFNSQSQLYELKPVPLDHEAFKTSIRQTLESGNPPDLYSYWAGARTASIIDQLEPIDDVWQAAKLDTVFSSALARAASEYHGKKYFLPLTQHYIGIFYNKKIFEKHRITPPATWQEFLAVCEKLKNQGVTPIALGAKDKWPAQFWFDMILLRTAPYEYRQRLMRGEAHFDDPQVSVVFQHWSQLIRRGYFNSRPNELAWDSGANESVYSGKAAMTLMGTWVIGYYGNEAHKWVAGRDYDFFPFPVIDPAIPAVSMGPIDGLVVPKKAVNRDGAKKVLAYLSDIGPQQAMSRGSGALAPNIRVPRASYGDMQQRILDEIAKSTHFTFAFDLSTPPQVAELGLNAFSEFLEFPAEFKQIQRKLSSEATQQFRRMKEKP
jgi:multiple sugar transport system substrate-binding protein/raffinose/stachyose/melibiose transport system substrate-binding protein